MTLRIQVETTLREHGIQPTAQRVEVGMVLLAGPCHLSAEQVLEALRRKGSSVSKATVYNTLNLLSSRGLLRAVAVDPDRVVYDSTTTRHHHFLNEDTGELTDIDPDLVTFPRLPRLPDGMLASSVELIIRVRKRRPA